MNRPSLLAAGLLSTAVATPAAIAATPTELDTVIVTATRTAETADASLAPVTVITRAEIVRSQAQNVPELLRGLPGVDFAQTGAVGQPSSVFLRGTNSDHVLVLVDGIKLGSATLGTTAFEHLPLAQIERIELVRGPRASMYGSDAIGGVLQIFTRNGGGDKLSGYANLQIGNQETGRLSIGANGGTENLKLSANVSTFRTRGQNAWDNALNDNDDDGNEQHAGNASLHYALGSGSISLNTLHSTGSSEYDGFPNVDANFNPIFNGSDYSLAFQQRVLSGQFKYRFVEDWETTLRIGQSNDDGENRVDGRFDSRFDTQRREATWQNDVFIGNDHIVSAGVDYSEDDVDSSTAYDETTRDNLAGFVQWQGGYGPVDWRLAGRYDDNEAFGDHTTQGADIGVAVSEHIRVIASYGTAFKAPSFNELYFPNFSNPDLAPEESESFELGLQGNYGWLTWQMNLYHTAIDQLISFQFNPNDNSFLPFNIDNASINGAELGFTTTMADWAIGVNGSYTDTEDKQTGNRLPRRAELSGKLTVDNTTGKLSSGLTVTGYSDRFDDANNTVKLPGYAVVDLRFGIQLTPDVAVKVKWANVLDQDYQTVAGYPALGRTWLATLAIQPQ